MNVYPIPNADTASNSVAADPAAHIDWQVLVLIDMESTVESIKGIWGPYSSMDLATTALEELRQWPLDGRWDVRRLNKFVARKAATKDQFTQFTWQ